MERSGRLVMDVPLSGNSFEIGRADVDSAGMPVFPDLDLTASDPEQLSSRRHARLSLDQGQFFIEDLGSRNGTFVENVGRLNPGSRVPLPTGRRVMFGPGGPIIHYRIS